MMAPTQKMTLLWTHESSSLLGDAFFGHFCRPRSEPEFRLGDFVHDLGWRDDLADVLEEIPSR